MLKTLIPLAVLPVLVFAQPAEARRLFWWETANPDQPYQQAYGAPEYQDLYGAPDSSDEQFNQRQYQLYQREMHKRYGNQTDIAPDERFSPRPPSTYSQPTYRQPAPYAAPLYLAPRPKKVVKAKPKLPEVSPPVVASVAPSVPAPEPQVTAKSSGVVTCEKGATIVSGFGFENVHSKTCEAGSLAYNAERSGKPFEVTVNPKTGELIAVKKLPAPAPASTSTPTQTSL